MARYTDSLCKRCRRLGAKLYLKGERCYTDKCAMEKKKYPPGQQQKKRGSKLSEYGLQLREKQKMKDIYGLLERQFRKCFVLAKRRAGLPSENLFRILESRLDNMVYRMGLSSSRNMARQEVSHRYFLVNDKKVNIPSFQVKINDIITVSEKYRNNKLVRSSIELMKQRGIPEWIDFNEEKMAGKLLRLPEIDEVNLPVNIQMIVELYTR